MHDAYKDKGLSGLANMGNTCYVNACLQLLSHTYEFNDFLSKNGGEYKARLNHRVDSVLLHEWDKLRTMMWADNCVISPGGFVSSMQKISKLKNMDLFSGFQQNDVAEFIGFMLDCFHTALSREVEMKVRGVARNATDRAAQECYEMMASMYKKQYSEVLDVFYGVQVSMIEPLHSPTTNHPPVLSTKPEPFCILNLSLPSIKNGLTLTLFDCLDHHCAPEVLSGDNAWFNEATGKKQDVKKRLSFWSLPNVLIIVLKRFEMNARGQVRKIQVPVDVPCNRADFSKYVHGYNRQSYVYDLFGVCNHHGGSPMGGHYTATIRNANNRWYACNDTLVKEVPLTDNSIASNLPYCLFYRKIKQ
ncbi:MAG: ubiquitin carboxyl-terminal hydrolase [Actinobacteria bacterium]|jgi:ubiquitin C-terminal hydrolase|nr:ubiquitin carboxyl-terminal hydrolase [Actinomycetota bacterium]